MNDPRRHPVAFTLTELLVGLAIIIILAGLTTITTARVLADARQASGVNTVTATLTRARTAALAERRSVLVVFRPAQVGGTDELVAMTAVWSGDTTVMTVAGARVVADRFVPVRTSVTRTLPRNILVAGPAYRTAARDDAWITPTRLSRPDEAAGELLGVLFGPDGATRTSHADHDATHLWVDVDEDGRQRLSGERDGDAADPWRFDHPGDETFVNVVPYLAVYDDGAARTLAGDDDWRGPDGGEVRDRELSAFISARAERLHFNAFTGVSMR